MSTVAQAISLNGITTVNILSGGKSVSIVVTKGTVNLSFTGTGCIGTNIPIPMGTSLNYTVESAGQNMRCNLKFDGTTANTSAIIIQTRF